MNNPTITDQKLTTCELDPLSLEQDVTVKGTHPTHLVMLSCPSSSSTLVLVYWSLWLYRFKRYTWACININTKVLMCIHMIDICLLTQMCHFTKQMSSKHYQGCYSTNIFENYQTHWFLPFVSPLDLFCIQSFSNPTVPPGAPRAWLVAVATGRNFLRGNFLEQILKKKHPVSVFPEV